MLSLTIEKFFLFVDQKLISSSSLASFWRSLLAFNTRDSLYLGFISSWAFIFPLFSSSFPLSIWFPASHMNCHQLKAKTKGIVISLSLLLSLLLSLFSDLKRFKEWHDDHCIDDTHFKLRNLKMLSQPLLNSNRTHIIMRWDWTNENPWQFCHVI